MLIKMYNKYIAKARLKNAFTVAGIYLTIKKPNADVKRYPSIGGVHETEDFLDYTFYLPQGLDPNILAKKEYIFRQTFGDVYELSGNGIKYNLRIYKRELLKEWIYKPEEMKERCKQGLPIVAGYNMLGDLIVYDMTPNPHLLIAGETGSGKSVCLKVILTTLLLFKRHEIDFYLADMKRAEFHIFRNCEGVKEVITDKGRLNQVLNKLHKELDRRGNILDQYEVEHIDEYNKIKGVEKLKSIIIAIDEVAILRDSKNIREIIEDISTQGRALKMFLILSMQRPDSKILNGQLKANLTVRYAFRHADGINSRITLGEGSEEDASTIRKSEKGKFFMKHEEIKLLQAPYLTTEAAKELLKDIKVVPPKNDEIRVAEAFEDIPEETAEEFAEGVTIIGGKKDE